MFRIFWFARFKFMEIGRFELEFIQVCTDPVAKARLAAADVLPGGPDYVLALLAAFAEHQVPLLEHLLNLAEGSGSRDEPVKLRVLLRRKHRKRMHF